MTTVSKPRVYDFGDKAAKSIDNKQYSDIMQVSTIVFLRKLPAPATYICIWNWEES